MWALKRKFFIILFFILIIVVSLIFVYKIFLMVTPTCFDDIQNGTEEGIDCGGECNLVCKLKVTHVNILWAKTFKVSGGVSNIATLIENPNFDYNLSAIYNIKIFDDFGAVINNFNKKIRIDSGEKRLIFIPSVITGEKKVTKTLVTFKNIESATKDLTKEKDVEKLIILSKIIIKDINQTRLVVDIKNDSLFVEKNIEVSAVLKKKDGEILSVGQTFIDKIKKRSNEKINITWPNKLETENIIIDIFLRKYDN